MKKQIVRRTFKPVKGFPADLHPVLHRIYAARFVTSAEELDYSLSNLHACSLLSGMDPALDLIADALGTKSRILIVADFDADGATSCAVAVRGLRLMGAENVHYTVPNRFEYGYGLTPEIVEIAATQSPDLLITVDNGISSMAGVEAARKKGIKVLITDHHLPGDTLPNADAIINPNQPGDTFPSKHLAGVGVMFYLLMALRIHLRNDDWFNKKGINEPNLAQLLDLVALGTVADVVPLDYNNRILVAQGLARIQNGRCHAGISALCRVASRNPVDLVSSDLSFALAPRLNAAGRLADMSLGIECLLTDDPENALELARELDQLNKERRMIEAGMKAQAMTEITRLQLDHDKKLPFGVCLFDPAWHEGVVGILASRIKDRIHRPVIAFARSKKNGELKGSARSIPGFHIRDALDTIAALYPTLIGRFGGHAMAAGLSLEEKDFQSFQRAFDEEVRQHLSQADLEGVIYSDGALNIDELALEMAEKLRLAGPWGQSFPEPIFEGEFKVARRRVVGDRHLKLKLEIESGRMIDAIAFNMTDEDWPVETTHIRTAYRLDVNDFNGSRTAQLLIEYLEPHDAKTAL